MPRPAPASLPEPALATRSGVDERSTGSPPRRSPSRRVRPIRRCRGQDVLGFVEGQSGRLQQINDRGSQLREDDVGGEALVVGLHGPDGKGRVEESRPSLGEVVARCELATEDVDGVGQPDQRAGQFSCGRLTIAHRDQRSTGEYARVAQGIVDVIGECAVGVQGLTSGPAERGEAGDFRRCSNRLPKPVDERLCTPHACQGRLGAVQVDVGDHRFDSAQGRRQLVQDGDDGFPDGSDRVCGQERDDEDADRASGQGIKAAFEAAGSAGGQQGRDEHSGASGLCGDQRSAVEPHGRRHRQCDHERDLPGAAADDRDQEIADSHADADADDELDSTMHPAGDVQADHRGDRGETGRW